MNRRGWISSSIFILMLWAGQGHGVQSTITEVEGTACMGDDKSRNQTRLAAIADARRRASEFVATMVESKTEVEDAKLKQDLISAYSKATVEVIRELDRGWYEEAGAGLCYRLKIQAEVIPHQEDMAKLGGDRLEVQFDDPALPLQAKIWTDKARYREGEVIKLFLKANKPFHARVVYRDVHGNLIQLLPNPYRSENYFEGGVTYRLPSGKDRFELKVTPPFGKETIVLYASTEPQGEIEIEDYGPVYVVTTAADELNRSLRGVKIQEKESDTGQAGEAGVDFVETEVGVVVER